MANTRTHTALASLYSSAHIATLRQTANAVLYIAGHNVAHSVPLR